MNREWMQEQREGEPIGDPDAPHRSAFTSRETVWSRRVLHGGGGPKRYVRLDGGVLLTMGHYERYWRRRAGEFLSRPEKWPVVTLVVQLPEGREELRSVLAEELAQAVDRFIERFGLTPPREEGQ